MTAGVQVDVERERLLLVEDKVVQFGGLQRHSEPSSPAQYSATRTVRTQGIFTYREDYRAASPGPAHALPWPREEGAESEVRTEEGAGHADGSWYMQLLHGESKRMEAWCREMEHEAEEHELSEESEYQQQIQGGVRTNICTSGNRFQFT